MTPSGCRRRKKPTSQATPKTPSTTQSNETVRASSQGRAPALAAAETGPFLHQLHGRLADGAGQDLEQVWMDRHGGSLAASALRESTDEERAGAVETERTLWRRRLE